MKHGKLDDLVVDSWQTTEGDKVEVYRSGRDCGEIGCDLAHYAGDFHWRVRASNGEVVGQGEGHPRKVDAVTAAMRHHPPVTE